MVVDLMELLVVASEDEEVSRTLSKVRSEQFGEVAIKIHDGRIHELHATLKKRIAIGKADVERTRSTRVARRGAAGRSGQTESESP